MKHLIFILIMLVPHSILAAWSVESPNGRLTTAVDLDDQGRPGFRVSRDGNPAILRSPLGIRMEHTTFESAMKLAGPPGVKQVHDRYTLFTGKRKHTEYVANELRLPLENGEGHRMDIVLRLSDDGLGYRYEFPGTREQPVRVTAESSGVQFPPGTRAWLQPKADARTGWSNVNPSYEEDYLQNIPVGTPSPTESGWIYPALFRTGDTWIVLSETGMDGRYAGTNLAQNSDDGLYRLRFPQEPETIRPGERLPESSLPFHSPWRLVLVGGLSTLVESTLGTDLAVPSHIDNPEWIKPGIAAWSWGVLKDDSVDYDVQKAFIDYASDMNWPYVLVDVEWDQRIGYERIAQLAEYAKGKDVSLLLWYNSSGDWNLTEYTPKDRLLTREGRRAEFARLKEMGIAGIKVDFFPGDGRSVFRYYLDIFADAADFGLLVNTHGSVLPRGMHRTYPNFLTSEAVKGFEFITFEQKNTDQEATHSAMMPFTRNLFDPMDFTPMVLGEIPGRERKTSNGFQLALPVLFTSGIQHLVTTPEQMAEMPGFVKDYLRALPANWDESRLLEGYPGRYVVMARRSGKRWYVAGINAETETRNLELDLGFIGAGAGRLISDGADWRQPAINEFKWDEARISLPHGTGFVMILEP